MSVSFACSHCGHRLTIPQDVFERRVAGRLVTIKCKRCASPVEVDGRKAAPATSGGLNPEAPKPAQRRAPPRDAGRTIVGLPTPPKTTVKETPPLPSVEPTDPFAGSKPPSPPARTSQPDGLPSPPARASQPDGLPSPPVRASRPEMPSPPVAEAPAFTSASAGDFAPWAPEPPSTDDEDGSEDVVTSAAPSPPSPAGSPAARPAPPGPPGARPAPPSPPSPQAPSAPTAGAMPAPPAADAPPNVAANPFLADAAPAPSSNPFGIATAGAPSAPVAAAPSGPLASAPMVSGPVDAAPGMAMPAMGAQIDIRDPHAEFRRGKRTKLFVAIGAAALVAGATFAFSSSGESKQPASAVTSLPAKPETAVIGASLPHYRDEADPVPGRGEAKIPEAPKKKSEVDEPSDPPDIGDPSDFARKFKERSGKDAEATP